MYVVKGLRLCNFLLLNGFHIVKVDRDISNKNFLVFLFQDTDKLRKYITIFSNNKNK